MFAVIFPSSQVPTSHALTPVAGRPLVSRQLQWLRANGVERVALMLPTGPEGDAVIEWLRAHEPVSRDVTFVRDAAGPNDAAERAGFGDRTHLQIGSEVLGDGDLSRLFALSARGRVVAHLLPPEGSLAEDAFVSVESGGQAQQATDRTFLVRGPGWGARIADLATARELGDLILARALPASDARHAFPVQVHADERAPGVWVARGAHLDVAARVRGPVWIGPGAVVEAGATLGPGAHVGARAVVSSGASVKSSFVDEGVIVASGRHHHARLSVGHSIPLRGGEARVAPELTRRPTAVLARLTAAAGLGVVVFAVGWLL